MAAADNDREAAQVTRGYVQMPHPLSVPFKQPSGAPCGAGHFCLQGELCVPGSTLPLGGTFADPRHHSDLSRASPVCLGLAIATSVTPDAADGPAICPRSACRLARGTLCQRVLQDTCSQLQL